jgi:ribose transport system ATP-binding protein
VLEAAGLTRAGVVENITFRLHKGEILGLAGLVGAGRSELAEAIFGVHPATSGTLRLDGKAVSIRRPAQAIELGIGLVPEDRKAQGLFLSMDVSSNVVMALFRRLARWGVIRWGQVGQIARQFIARLSIRTPSPQQRVRNLSGGNQQKVVIAKWLTREPKVLILDEPTRGIDVSARRSID